MQSEKYMAADFGASSGRLMLGEIGRTLQLREIHRFSNEPALQDSRLRWDFDRLFQELQKGFEKIAAAGHRHVQGVGVDTWGVDFGLIGPDGRLLENPVAYRDSRTHGMIEAAGKKMTKADIYAATGIQFMEINTLFQLYSMTVSGEKILDRAETLLFMPDLFHYRLTGVRQSEYSIASTSQMLNAVTRKWDRNLFQKLDLPLNLMMSPADPGTQIGPPLRSIR